ncbi:MAG: hypothetical protein O7D91_02945 [Planctomycetota bacterium]|nr:hypothetical protein [Planctomycetota bacterium]
MNYETPPTIATVRLTTCPKCGYQLEGLPAAHRCPECGYAYDEQTFVLVGITRGMRSLKLGRAVLWILVAVGAFLGPSCVSVGAFSGHSQVAAVTMGMGAAWLGLVVYLLLTAKQEKKGMEKFLFSAGGYGQCTSFVDAHEDVIRLTPWSAGLAVSLKRNSARWQRLQIGLPADRGAHLGKIVFDAVVQCDEAQAAWIAQILTERIATTRGGADASQEAPPIGQGDPPPTA